MKSFWEEERKKHGQFDSINNNMNVSVCIIGGGLTGLSTAYYLSKYCSVVVLEKDRICSHTSGNTTGKITSQHGIFYEYLKNSQSKEYAKQYLAANEKAIKNIEEIIKNENIECDFEKEKAYVYTTKQTEFDKIKSEQQVVENLHEVKNKVAKNLDLPIETIGAIEFDGQAKFHPIKYGYGLASSILKNNGKIFENSKVGDIKKENGKYSIYVNKNKIVADYVVMATRYPIMKIPGYYFLKMYQSTSFAVVADVKQKLFDGMYISLETPTVSFRTIKDGDKELLLAVGYDYKTGSDEFKDGYSRLESIIKRVYPEAEILYKWSAEDCITLDKIPYIGEYSNTMPNVYIATGFNKWGITASNLGANIITDKILGRENEYEDLFKATRVEPIKNKAEVGNMLKEAGKSIVLSRFKLPKEEEENLKIGEGKIVNINSQKVGIYKDKEGKIYKVKPVCTHLGCELYFNNVEKIWECPCHGSKFSYDGKIIEDPANKDLKCNITTNNFISK